MDWGAASVDEGWTTGGSISITSRDDETVRIVREDPRSEDSTVLLNEPFRV